MDGAPGTDRWGNGAASTGASTFSEACTLGAKPPSLFTHVYECKVFARIVCGSRVQRAAVFNGTWRACREKGVARGGGEGTACAREGVSTLGELPFKAGNNEMRVAGSSLTAWRFTAAPLQTDVEKTAVAVSSFPLSVSSPLL